MIRSLLLSLYHHVYLVYAFGNFAVDTALSLEIERSQEENVTVCYYSHSPITEMLSHPKIMKRPKGKCAFSGSMHVKFVKCAVYAWFSIFFLTSCRNEVWACEGWPKCDAGPWPRPYLVWVTLMELSAYFICYVSKYDLSCTGIFSIHNTKWDFQECKGGNQIKCYKEKNLLVLQIKNQKNK